MLFSLSGNVFLVLSMNNEDDWSKTKWRHVSRRRKLAISFSNSFFSSAVNEQRRRLERNKMTTCQHEEETYYFPCNNPIPGSKAVYFPMKILLFTLCQDKA